MTSVFDNILTMVLTKQSEISEKLLDVWSDFRATAHYTQKAFNCVNRTENYAFTHVSLV